MSERRNVCETEASNGVRQQGGRDRLRERASRERENEGEREDERDKVQRVRDRDHLATSESKRQ